MSNARDKANIPALNFSSTGIDDNATSTAITINSSNYVGTSTRVGIGTTNPSQLLEIYGTSPNIQWTYSGDDNNHRIFSFSDDFYIRADANNTGAGNLVFQNGGSSERMRIDSSGNVGIGTSSPNFPLEIYKASTSEVAIGTDNGGTAQLSFWEGNSSTKEFFVKYDGFNNNGVIGTSGVSNAIVIARDNGRVGIGTSSPTAQLDVTETIQIDNTVTIGGSVFTGQFDIQLNDLQAVNGNQHRRYGLRLSYGGIAGNATNGQQKDVLIVISGLSSWTSAIPIDTGGGTIAVTVTSSSSNSMNIRVTTPASNCVGAYVATLFASGATTMICYG